MFESKAKINAWAECADDYYYGKNGEKKDYEMAVCFYEKAARKKHPHAMFMLGVCYESGNFVKKDIERAEALYKEAAALGNTDAKTRLDSEKPPVPDLTGGDTGEIPIITDMNQAEYFEQRGEHERAFEHYKRAAQDGSGEACWRIAGLYGKKGKPAEQLEWAQRAADLGHQKAAADLPVIRKAAKFMGQLGAIGSQTAAKKRKQDENDGLMDRANAYIKNEDYKGALSCYEKIANSDDDLNFRVQVQMQIARIYYLGGGGVFYNNEKAAEWASKAKQSAIVLKDDALIKEADDILTECD